MVSTAFFDGLGTASVGIEAIDGNHEPNVFFRKVVDFDAICLAYVSQRYFLAVDFNGGQRFIRGVDEAHQVGLSGTTEQKKRESGEKNEVSHHEGTVLVRVYHAACLRGNIFIEEILFVITFPCQKAAPHELERLGE